MQNFIGKICPYCKTEIKEGDEIVVCSSCDMPHHKDCWIENQGCTTFGCMGTIKAVDGGSSSVTNTECVYEETPTAAQIFCTRCGAANRSTSAFCAKCGNALRTSAAPAPAYTPAVPASSNPYYTHPVAPTYPQSNIYGAQPTYSRPAQSNTYGRTGTDANESNMAALVGKNAEYYMPKFWQLKHHDKKASWNWSAFLFSAYWFMYRKMYGYGFAALALPALIAIFGSRFFSVLALAGYIVIGIFANYIYMQWLENKADELRLVSEPFRQEFIAKEGGVNTTAAVLTVVGWGIVAGILSSL